MSKGYISEYVGGGRIVSHGQINDLSSGFNLPQGELFSIYVRPKGETEETDIILDMLCYQDEESSPCPVGLREWCPMLIRTLAPAEGVTDNYDIYWGSGMYVATDKNEG